MNLKLMNFYKMLLKKKKSYSDILECLENQLKSDYDYFDKHLTFRDLSKYNLLMNSLNELIDLFSHIFCEELDNIDK